MLEGKTALKLSWSPHSAFWHQQGKSPGMQLTWDGEPQLKPNQKRQSFPLALSLKWKWTWGWLENVFLQPPLYLPSPRVSCQLQEPSFKAWIHVTLETFLRMMGTSSFYTWRSHGPIQNPFRGTENPPSSHPTKKIYTCSYHIPDPPLFICKLYPIHLKEKREPCVSMRQ